MQRTLRGSAGWLLACAATLGAWLIPVASNADMTRTPSAGLPGARSFRQTVWTVEQGLPDNTVQALLQTRDGYLWIGTAGGLVRFDGLKFTVFQRRTHPAMVSDDCRTLAQGTDESLWIGTADGLLHYAGGVFRRFTQDDGLVDSKVRLLLATRYNEIWIAATKSLSCWRNGALIRHLGPDELTDYHGYDILALAQDSEGKLWVSHNLGLHFFDRQLDRFRPHALSDRFKGLSITAIFSDKPQSYWLWSGDLKAPICFIVTLRVNLPVFSRRDLAIWRAIPNSSCPTAPEISGSRRGDLDWIASARANSHGSPARTDFPTPGYMRSVKTAKAISGSAQTAG